ERRIGSAEVTGPIPVSSSFEKYGSLVNIKASVFCVSDRNAVKMSRKQPVKTRMTSVAAA
ncbi:MAG: hypothetical protein NC389_08380, partial [Acetatifactor muris]|nr:hypothetical protein [Acetatifactor muris]